MSSCQYQIDTCHDHARDALHEGEEDDDWTVGIDVAGAIPDHISPRCFRLDGDGELPDGGHGLDAEEQGRGEVVDPGDTLEQKSNFTFLASNSSSAES